MKPTSSSRLTALAAAVLAFVSSCQGCLGCTSPVNDPNSTLPKTCQAEQPLIEPQKLDILFVIDNSGSMREEQEAVARELTAFIEEIRKAGGVRQDFYAGAITTTVYQHSDVGGLKYYVAYDKQAGKLQPVPDALADGGVALGTGTERVLRGDDPQFIEKFSRLVRQGTFGSGQETPFEAVRRAVLVHGAVEWDQGGNKGFFRDGARLLVVVLTDEDDCSEIAVPSVVTVGDNPAVADCTVGANSLTPLSEYHRIFTEEFLDGTGRRREVIWTAIAPVGISTKQAQEIIDGTQARNVDCPTSNQAGYRHRAMAELFDTSLANLDSICRASFRETLIEIAELASVAQTLEVKNVPDPRMLQVEITRADGSKQRCTLQQGLSAWEPPVDAGLPGRITFGADCRRRADDKGIQIRLLCAT